jgi:hypothetical protein
MTPEELMVFVKERIKTLTKIREEMRAEGNHAADSYTSGALDSYDIIRIELEGKVTSKNQDFMAENLDETTFDNKALILGEVWVGLKSEETWKDFIWNNDVGLPLAFAYAEEIIELNEQSRNYILDTWDSLLEAMDLEDLGYASISEMFDQQNE